MIEFLLVKKEKLYDRVVKHFSMEEEHHSVSDQRKKDGNNSHPKCDFTCHLYNNNYELNT